jgi:hypothetical protein
MARVLFFIGCLGATASPRQPDTTAGPKRSVGPRASRTDTPACNHHQDDVPIDKLEWLETAPDLDCPCRFGLRTLESLSMQQRLLSLVTAAPLSFDPERS